MSQDKKIRRWRQRLAREMHAALRLEDTRPFTLRPILRTQESTTRGGERAQLTHRAKRLTVTLPKV